MSPKSALAAALALAFAPAASLAAGPLQDGSYSHYAPRTNQCYLVTVTSGEATRFQSFYNRDCSGEAAEDYPVEQMSGGFMYHGRRFFVHGHTEESISISFDTPANRKFDFEKQ